MLAAEWGTGQVFWSMLWFFLWVIWIWMLVVVFGDIFRSRDLGGWGKALWSIFVIVTPFLGVFVYLIVRGGSMQERAYDQARQQEQMLRQYVQETAGNGKGSAADELTRLADLRSQGVITEAEFQQAKAKALA
jgi:hypothetical protein